MKKLYLSNLIMGSNYINSEEESFIRAIQDDPTDDMNIKAYSDWLEERGDDKAKHIRMLVKIKEALDVNNRMLAAQLRRKHMLIYRSFEIPEIEFWYERQNKLINFLNEVISVSIIKSQIYNHFGISAGDGRITYIFDEVNGILVINMADVYFLTNIRHFLADYSFYKIKFGTHGLEIDVK